MTARQNPAKKTFWAWAIATFFGTGLGKPGPGTWASMATLLLWADYAWALHPTPQRLLFALSTGFTPFLLSPSFAYSISPSLSPSANSKTFPQAGASYSMMLPPACMLWV